MGKRHQNSTLMWPKLTVMIKKHAVILLRAKIWSVKKKDEFIDIFGEPFFVL